MRHHTSLKYRFLAWTSAMTLTCLISSAIGQTGLQPQAFAESASSSTAYEAEKLAPLKIVGADLNSEEVKGLLASFKDLLAASNKHSLNDIIKHYSPRFISGDNFNLAQLKQMIQETWEAYPDIHYESTPIEIRMNGEWATVDTFDKAVASSPPDKEIMVNTPGRMTSESRSRLFMKKNGNDWEITSDYTLWEQAKILYGIEDDVKLVLSVPEQVKAGDSYSAVVETNLPEGTFVIGTISNDTIRHPQPKAEGHFRTLDGGLSQLKRMLVSNSENRNEIVSATLGISNVYQKYHQDRPGMAVNGIATIVKRVNVVPISNEDLLQAIKKQQVVNTSANGAIVVPEHTSSPVKPEDEDNTIIVPSTKPPAQHD